MYSRYPKSRSSTTVRKTYPKKTVVYRKKAYPKKKVAYPNSKCYDRSEQGMANGFVPAFNKAKFFGKVRYGASALNLTALTSQANSYVFSANGLFDPNITGGSLTPGGFAQLISSYEHYTCYKSIITVTFTNNGTTPSMVGISIEPDSTASTDPSNVLELPYSQFVQLEGSASYGSSKTISMTCNLSKYFGTPVTNSQALYRGDAVSNPVEQAYFHCKTFSVKGGTADIFMTVKIDYHAIWTEPRELTASLNKKIMNLVIEESKEQKSEKPEKVEQPSGIYSLFGK